MHSSAQREGEYCIRRCTHQQIRRIAYFFSSVRLTCRHHPHNLISLFNSVSPRCTHALVRSCSDIAISLYFFHRLLLCDGALTWYPLFLTEFVIVLFPFHFIASSSPLSSFELFRQKRWKNHHHLNFILNLRRSCSYIVNIRIFCNRTSRVTSATKLPTTLILTILKMRLLRSLVTASFSFGLLTNQT